MKGLSIKSKIMLFYTVCTTLIVAIMLLVMVHISGRVVDRDIRDNLVLMVEEDVDDLDFDIIDEDDIGDAYEEGAVVFYTEEGLVGSLSVDDSYITSKNGVRILVYGPHDRLLLGNVYDYDIDKSKLKDGSVSSDTFGETDYYLYTRYIQLTDKNVTVDFTPQNLISKSTIRHDF